MGLDNDSFAMPKGRCSSEISVFNYPEHLNPFYEDDHHKRLRFWKLNFHQDGRRKSFSLTGLKDIWTLKPFTLKKKSSTLGINKTSESPPQFRRNLDNITSTSTNFLNTKARPGRTTSNEDFTANKNFYTNGVQQNPFSQSRVLPNVKVVEPPFERNSNYRSTLQIGENLGARTRTRNQNIKEIYPLSISRGSSVTSSGSTNPFDSEEDLEIKELEITVVKKKKRKAPAPPVKQNAETSLEQNKKLSNLTAEIVSFVENVKESETRRIIPEFVERRQKENASTSNIREYMNSENIDSNEIGLQDSAVGNRIQKCTPPPNTREKSDSKFIISGTSPLVCRLEDNTSTSNLNEKSDVKKIMPGTSALQCRIQEKSVSTNVVEKCNFNITISETSTLKLGGNEITPSSNLSELGRVQCIHINSKNINPPPRQIMTSFSTTKSVMNSNKDNLVSNDHNEKWNSSSLCSEKIESTTHESQIANSNEQHSLERSSRIFIPNTANICSIDTKDIRCASLKITESTDNISDPCKTGHNSTLETFTTVNKVNPKNDSSLSYPWTKSTLAPLRSSLPAEKRRSVQEIIESINRNQRLLCSSKPINTDNQRINILDFSVDKHNKNSNATKENIALTREPSPTTLNLDWNPLPKPKRSKNIYEYSDT